MKYDMGKLSKFLGRELNSSISFDILMECIVKINQPTTLKIYGMYREVEGELVKSHIHSVNIANSYISMKIEYGRRFKDFIVYSDVNTNTFDGLVNMYYQFVIEYINWYNTHQ